MTTLQLCDNSFPSLQLQDTAEKALQVMNDCRVSYLPVVSEDKFLGLVNEADLEEEENKQTTLESFQNDLIPASVNAGFHFLKAAYIFNLYQTGMVPVVGENNELLGTISPTALINALGTFCGSPGNGALVVLEIERTRFTISEINSIVESDGATLLHLNVSSLPDPHLLEVTLQINKKEISTIIATFERYEYSVSYYSGEELFENEINTNYHNLMNYLDI
ncbi:MAG: CBS domain-containing protein [Ginsengibacter sp.]